MDGTSPNETPPEAGKPANEPARSSGFFGRRKAIQSPSEALQPEAAPPPPPLPPSKRRPTLSAVSGFLTFILVGAVAVMIGLVVSAQRMRDPGPLTADKTVFIVKGTDTPEIISQLEREGVIDSSTAMQIALVIEGKRSNLKAGEYLFRRNASMREVIDTLVGGKQILHSVTIPEGLTSEQIVARLKDIEFLEGEVGPMPKEGSLLPETYRVVRGFSRSDLIRKMQDDQRKVMDVVWSRRSAEIPLRTAYEMLTLASIVEKETGRADERSRVAGVFINRLNKRMRLQSDPTIVYGLVGGKGTLGRGILRSEVEKPTAYNTYTIDGLPPGPIANPGRAALEAVANPSRTAELFFVADGTGGHVFADSLEQHNRNVQRWRQIERDAKDKNAPNVDRVAPANPDQRTDLSPSVFGALPTSLSAKPEKPVAPSLGIANAAAALAKHTKIMPSDEQTPKVAALPQGMNAFAMTPGLDDISFDTKRGGKGPNAAELLDGPATDQDAALPGDPATYPVSPTRRAEQKAMAMKLGLDPGSDALPKDMTATPLPQAAAAYAPTNAPRPRAFDASEGTALDPLRDKSWDLNSAKVVPNLR